MKPRKCKLCKIQDGCECSQKLAVKRTRKRNGSIKSLGKRRNSQKEKRVSTDCNSSQNDHFSNMFKSIEVWIAAQKNYHQYKLIEETRDVCDESQDRECKESSWEVTLDPKRKIRIRESLWI